MWRLRALVVRHVTPLFAISSTYCAYSNTPQKGVIDSIHKDQHGVTYDNNNNINFFSRPLPERLAAICVANYTVKTNKHKKIPTTTIISAESLPSTPTMTQSLYKEQKIAEQLHGAMPIKEFVELVPHATRDAIFASKCDVQSWIKETQLLELVCVLEDGSVVCDATDSNINKSNNSTNSSVKQSKVHYGPLYYVRVGMGADELLQLVYDAGSGGSGTEISESHSRYDKNNNKNTNHANSGKNNNKFGDSIVKNNNKNIYSNNGNASNTNGEGIDMVPITASTLQHCRQLINNSDLATSVLTEVKKIVRKRESTQRKRYVLIKNVYSNFMHTAEMFPPSDSLRMALHNLSYEVFNAFILYYCKNYGLVKVTESSPSEQQQAREQEELLSSSSIDEKKILSSVQSLSNKNNAPSLHLETESETNVVKNGMSSNNNNSDADEDSLLLLPQSEKVFWLFEHHFIALSYEQEKGPPPFTQVQPFVSRATLENNYGGWGSAISVPTKQDVYEILKYVPINWGNMGSLNIPVEVRRRHIRCASVLMWFRRQPWYFEIRDMAGTLEIRRSIVLHPEAHGLTASQARQQLELKINNGTANNLLTVGPEGAVSSAQISATEKIFLKFMLRVCPPYFAPLSLVMQRYIKKNLTEAILLNLAKARPQQFEILKTKYSDIPLVRKRVGADSARWRSSFMTDLESIPEDVPTIFIICNRLCPLWDRPEYVYVRLSQSEQVTVGGYENMLRVLKRHPAIFRVGVHFVCRVDASDPLLQSSPEPSQDDMTSRTYNREENPYQSPLDMALVFHYVMPAGEPCTAAFFLEHASPAMRAVLPSRVITLLQQFPRLFTCTETSPGVYSVRKVMPRKPVKKQFSTLASTTSTNDKSTSQSSTTTISSSTSTTDAATTMTDASKQNDNAEQTSTGGADDGANVTTSTNANTTSSVSTNEHVNIDSVESDNSWELDDELDAEEKLTRADVIAAIKELIPANGVEGAHLLLWASMAVQKAANLHYGGIIKMVELEKTHFRVVENERAKTIYRIN